MGRPKLPDEEKTKLMLSVYALLAKGYIIPAEAADMLNVARSTIHRNCKRWRIQPTLARKAYLAKWRRRAHGSGWQPPSKAQLRAMGIAIVEKRKPAP